MMKNHQGNITSPSVEELKKSVGFSRPTWKEVDSHIARFGVDRDLRKWNERRYDPWGVPKETRREWVWAVIGISASIILALILSS